MLGSPAVWGGSAAIRLQREECGWRDHCGWWCPLRRVEQEHGVSAGVAPCGLTICLVQLRGLFGQA